MKINYLPQDNEARVNGGIGRYDGVPYNIQLVNQTSAILSPIYRKASAEPFVVDLSDARFDISSPPLGWINTKQSAIYVMRRPERNYKQTLRVQQLAGYAPNGLELDGGTISNALFSREGERMFMDNYPTLKEAIASLTSANKVYARAITRNVCIATDTEGVYRVYYKLEEVGTLDIPSNVVTIPKRDLAWIVSKYIETFDWKVE